MSGQGGQETADSWSSGGAAPPEEPPTPPTAARGLAIASLACGIFGLFCSPTAIVGLILGIVALVKISRSKGRLEGQALAIAGTAVSGMMLLLAILSLVALLPAIGRARMAAERVKCTSQLRNLALGLAMYETDYRDELPEGLEDVYTYMPVPPMYVCPTDPEPMVIAGGLRCSYHYVGRLSPDTDERVILIYENAGNHPDGRNLVFMDLHAEFLPEDEFAVRLKESLELVKEAGWEEYPEERRAEIEAFYAAWPER